MEAARRLLSQWMEEPAAAEIHPVAKHGFSGARVWRVEHNGEQFALRQWPRSTGSPGRLDATLALQSYLASDGLPVPMPVPTRRGAIIVSIDGLSWGLATWMPGVADYWQSPRPAKLEAALSTLARVHLSAARATFGEPSSQPRTAVSPAMIQRANRLQNFVSGEFYQLEQALSRHSSAELARQALSLIEQTAPAQLEASWRWRRAKLPLQWRLTDVWHDHVLFTEDRVTGIIDFDAAAIDSPAGDIARLLSSLVGDDAESWRVGLSAYESVRPLSPLELEAVRFFDTSGVVLAALNWINWLYRDSSALADSVDREAALERLGRLAARLGSLAAISRV